MAGTVTSDLTTVDSCDETTGWTAWGGSGLGVDDELMIEGLGCLGIKAKVGEGIIWKTITSIDMTNVLFYIWILANAFAKLETKANGGLQIRLGTDGSNYRTWYVGGKDAYRGGWECFCVKPTETGSVADVGTYDYTAITYMAVVFNCTSTSTKPVNFWDVIRYGTGLTVYGGTLASPATFADFLSSEDTNKYGVIYEYEGTLFVQGVLKFGSTSDASDTYFKDTSQIIVFIDRIVGASFYEIVLQGQVAQITEVYFGTKSGSAGISGCVFKASGTAKYKATATDANLTKYGFYGCSFINADVITLPAYNIDKEVLNTNFEACAEVIADTAIVKNCKFISSPSSAIRMSSTSHNITDSTFISCQRAVHITVAGPFTYNNLDFLGNTYDGYNTSGVSVTVEYDQYCSPAPSTYDPAGDAITYQTSVTLTIRKVKSGNEPTEYVQCSIHRKSDMYPIMNKEANVADDENPTFYKASESWTQTGIIVIVRAREKGWVPFEIELTIPSGGLDVTAVWLADPNYQA